MAATLSARQLWRSTRRSRVRAREIEAPKPDETLYPGFQPCDENDAYKWGMSIDLNRCTGCNACIIACVAENNIAGGGQGTDATWTSYALDSRGWLLRGQSGESADVLTSRCLACSVKTRPASLFARWARRFTARRPERHGLQPLRRHPLLLEQLSLQGAPLQLPVVPGLDTPQFKMMRNPEVTVRSRGVMEKCTYCVQRITQWTDSRRRKQGSRRSRMAKS